LKQEIAHVHNHRAALLDPFALMLAIRNPFNCSPMLVMQVVKAPKVRKAISVTLRKTFWPSPPAILAFGACAQPLGSCLER
jgi:hypothetical protein